MKWQIYSLFLYRSGLDGWNICEHLENLYTDVNVIVSIKQIVAFTSLSNESREHSNKLISGQVNAVECRKEMSTSEDCFKVGLFYFIGLLVEEKSKG